MPDEPSSDKIKLRLLECAESCLNHVRNVRWGEAVSAYVCTDDDGYKYDVRISVKCYERVERDKTPIIEMKK
jgi:hypothetical protein